MFPAVGLDSVVIVAVAVGFSPVFVAHSILAAGPIAIGVGLVVSALTVALVFALGIALTVFFASVTARLGPVVTGLFVHLKVDS